MDTLVDKKTYTESLFKGAAVPATGPLPSSSDFALDKSVHEFNVEKAKKLLDEAGYKDTDGDGYREKDGKKVTIELLSFTRLPEMPLAIEASQQQLKEVGIEAKIRKVEVSAVATEKDYAFTPYAVVAAPIGDPYAYFNSAVKTGGVGNVGHYSNAEADQKIEALATETDQKKRIQLSKDIQALMDKDHGYTIIVDLFAKVLFFLHIVVVTVDLFAINKAYNKNKGRFNIAGFRKGKADRKSVV